MRVRGTVGEDRGEREEKCNLLIFKFCIIGISREGGYVVIEYRETEIIIIVVTVVIFISL